MKNNFSARKKARYYGLQALYSWAISDNPLPEVEEYFLQDKSPEKVDIVYFKELLYQVAAAANELDSLFQPYLTRGLLELNPIELTILRIASYEFKEQPSIPYRVIINEALELAKKFGAVDSHKFINGVLDKLARELRKNEVNKYLNS